MTPLTAQQVTTLAKRFFSVARTLTEYREHHWDNMSREQHQRLSDLQWSIYNYTDDLLALSAMLAMEEAEKVLNRVAQVTKDVNHYIDREQNIEKVIGVASRVVMLGGAVISQSPLAIIATLADLTAALH